MADQLVSAINELIHGRNVEYFRMFQKEDLQAGRITPEKYAENMDRLLPPKMRQYALKKRGLA
jgi:hypothetical protein